MTEAAIDFNDIDLTDSKHFVDGVPHQWFTFLRHNAPVWWHEEADGPGFWAVTSYNECVAVNRDYEHFSSAKKATFIWELEEDLLEQHRLMMLNMDPPLHTRYRRLVNKGFTPRMVAQLHDRIHLAADRIIDNVIEKGTAEFVTDLSSELPLVVIAELLGVPNEDRHKMFDWSNRMIGNQDAEYQTSAEDDAHVTSAAEDAQVASMELYAYAAELFSQKQADPRDDLMSVLSEVEMEGEKLSELELELFFLLLTVAGNETTRNLISGAMVAFFDNPDQWDLLQRDRSLLPSAVEEMLRYVSPVMNFRRQSTSAFELGGQQIGADQKVVFFHVSGNRDETVFENPHAFDITRDPNPHIAFGGGGPHFCLGANLARMEIRVMFEHLLDRMPDIRLNGEVERLQSQFISGVKHIPVAFTPAARVSA
ncbi:MAG TPA: cytochrome P450 [Acidimicrobiales bacterium]|jgi:cholest-4-en-3-one 26-monooxygenase|nr:cytochrome P450 [Acidimicrobiales bacterium]